MPASECIICNNPSTLCCARCKCQLYCSKFCQKEDWRIHKLLCSSYLQFENPPHENARRGIYFSVDGEVKFTWETIEQKHDDDGGGSWDSPNLQRYFGSSGSRPNTYHTNVLRRRKLKEIITLWFNDTFLNDGSRPNKAVIAAVPEMMTGGAVWCGPLVAMKNTNSYYDKNQQFPNSNPGIEHMDMGDLRDVVDYLTNWKRTVDEPEEMKEARAKAMLNEYLGREMDPGPGDQIKSGRGVRINCLADVEAGRPQFEELETTVAPTADNFTSPPLPSRLGMSLQLRKIPPPPEWRFDSYKLQNPTVTFLHLNIDPKSPDFGWAPPEWDECIGSVAVTRTDGKELLPEHVELLCHYCRYFLVPCFEDTMGNGMDPTNVISKEEVLYRVSPKSFELFSTGFCSYKRSTENRTISYPDIVGAPVKVKGLRENFHKLKKFL